MFGKTLLIALAIASVSAVKIQDHGLEHGQGHVSSFLIQNHHHQPHGHEGQHNIIPHEELHNGHGGQHEIQKVHHETQGGHQQTQGGQHHAPQHVDYYAEPNYEFAYEVNDPHTHDIKQQHESRHGDIVNGEYSLHQFDGNVRVVKYHADKKSGFHADVKYSGHTKHIVPERHHHQ